MGQTGSPETSIYNQLTLRNNPQDGRIQGTTILPVIPELFSGG
jgi:hypothetical protein